MSHQQDYRTRIYENYATRFQDAPKGFDQEAAWHWGRGYRHYLRAWLPEDKNAKIIDLACGGVITLNRGPRLALGFNTFCSRLSSGRFFLQIFSGELLNVLSLAMAKGRK